MARIREGDLGSGVDFLGTNLSPDMPSLDIFKFCPLSTSAVLEKYLAQGSISCCCYKTK